VFNQVNNALLGKSTKDVTPEAMVFNESMLHDLNMNHYTPATMDPFSSVAYIPEENNFYHEWSIKAVAKKYGFYKLHEILPLRDYMEMPMFLIDDLITGVTEGRSERDKIDNPPDASGNHKLPKVGDSNKDLMEIMRQLGLDKKLI
jgi:hypothetical protein